MTYAEKLQNEDWMLARAYIMKRDKYTCQECGKLGAERFLILYDSTINEVYKEFDNPWIIPDKKSLELNVHHKCYRKGKNPWEYDADDLITVCPECHKNIHETMQIPYYVENGNLITYLIKCDRCEGFGYIPRYYHVQAGICFKCWGEGVNIINIM